MPESTGIGSAFAVASNSSHVRESAPARTGDGDEPRTFIALGDSGPEGAHCGYCETFAGRYANGLRTLAGASVHFVDLTGDAQPYFQMDGGGTGSLLRALRDVSSFADQVASGDVIMIATGPNELERAFEPYAKGQCGDGFACVQRLEHFWLRNFNAILDEIHRLRGDRPTAIRLVSAANFFISDPSATKGLPPDAMKFGAKSFEALKPLSVKPPGPTTRSASTSDRYSTGRRSISRSTRTRRSRCRPSPTRSSRLAYPSSRVDVLPVSSVAGHGAVEMKTRSRRPAPSHPREGTGNNGKRWVTLRRKLARRRLCGPLTCAFAADS
jgi:hypothetical protein